MSHEAEEIVGYWMGRARESIDEAELMADARHWNAALNRLCYACFYAVTGLVHQDGGCLRQSCCSSRGPNMSMSLSRCSRAKQ